MAREYFKNLPDRTTPLRAERINGLLNGEESIEKVVVGSVEGKNLLPNEFQNETINGLSISKGSNGELILSGTPTANVRKNITLSTPIYLKAGTYTLSLGNPVGKAFWFYLRSGSTEIVSLFANTLTDTTFTITEDKNITLVGFYTTNTNESYNFTLYLMLEKGPEATNYTPFETYANSESEVYSTSEIKIGRWIDGKPLYRKVIIGTCASAINTTLTLGNISNLKDVAEINANWKANDNYRYFMSNPSESPVVYINASGDVNENHKGTYFNSVSIIVTIKYTKTTD